MRLRPFAWLPLLALTFAGFSPLAQAEPLYFEATLITDNADDFATNGALDIVAVHVGERFAWNTEAGSGKDNVNFRIELRNRAHMDNFQGETDLEYTIGFKVGSTAVVRSVRMTQTCQFNPPPGAPGSPAGYVCGDPTVSSPHFTGPDLGVVIVLDAAAEGLTKGATVTDIWAASATISGNSNVPDQEQRIYQDLAPKDNANQPEGSQVAPAAFGSSYTVAGVFPFLTLASSTPSNRYALPGGGAEFDLVFKVHDEFSGEDFVDFVFTTPAGWRAEPNIQSHLRVTTGGTLVPVTVTVKPPALATEGDTGLVVMDALLTLSGGHVIYLATVTVSGSKVALPEYDFELSTPGPFKAGETAHHEVVVTRDAEPLNLFEVRADFIQGGKRVQAVDAAYVADGRYEFNYTYPNGGDWTVDVYVSELQPSPYESFAVQVAGADKGLPGPGLFALAAAIGAALALGRRRSG